jgi:hypothetical protein
MRAAEVLGGEELLATRLEVKLNHLHLWIRGVVTPPTDVFLTAADIVSEHEVQQLSVKTRTPDTPSHP